MYQLPQLSRCNRKNCLNLFYVCDFWKSEDFQFAFHILCIGSDKIGHDFRNFYKLFFWGVKRHKKRCQDFSWHRSDCANFVPSGHKVGCIILHFLMILVLSLFCNVMQGTPGRYVHSFRAILAVSDLFCPLPESYLLGYKAGFFNHDHTSTHESQSKKLSTELFRQCYSVEYNYGINWRC